MEMEIEVVEIVKILIENETKNTQENNNERSTCVCSMECEITGQLYQLN